MTEFLEYDDVKRSIKNLNLDDFSLEDLEKYITELNDEIFVSFLMNISPILCLTNSPTLSCLWLYPLFDKSLLIILFFLSFLFDKIQ